MNLAPHITGALRIDRLFAVWRDVPDWGWVPVLAEYATADDLPDDLLSRRLVILGPTGPFLQLPTSWDGSDLEGPVS